MRGGRLDVTGRIERSEASEVRSVSHWVRPATDTHRSVALAHHAESARVRRRGRGADGGGPSGGQGERWWRTIPT